MRVVGADLDAEVAAADPGPQVVPEEMGQVDERSRAVVREPNRLCPALPKRAGPNPNVMVRSDGPRPTASPVSLGGLLPVRTEPTSSPRVIRAAAADHIRSSRRRSATELPIMSSAANCRSLCAGVAIPAWWAP